MRLITFFTTLYLTTCALTACQQNQSEPEPDPVIPTQGTPTGVGKPIGASVSSKIGPAGGSIATDDKMLTLTIPAGALTRDTTITLQPVENKAWGGAGPGYVLGPENLEFEKPATLTWNYTDQDLVGSAPEALGIAFQQADRSWQGRRNVVVDKAQKKASTPIDKLLSVAFYEAYYMTPSEGSLVPAEHVDLKIFFHPGREDESGLTPLSMPALLRKEDVRNWKLNGKDATGNPDPQLGTLGATGNGASATYVAPSRVPNPNQAAVSVEVVLKSKAKLILISNFVIEAANGFQFAGAKVDSAEVGAISVVEKEFFQISLSERNLNDQRQAVVTLSMLPFPGVGSYEVTDDHTISITAMDRDRKSWSDSYYPRTGKKVIGPLSVFILAYDKQNKRVAGKISGTLHYYDEKTDQHKSTQITARFNAASPY